MLLLYVHIVQVHDKSEISLLSIGKKESDKCFESIAIFSVLITSFMIAICFVDDILCHNQTSTKLIQMDSQNHRNLY